MKLSIIIPVLNEEKGLIHFLQPLQKIRQQGHEIILVDGGSSDNSIEIASNLVDKVIISSKGRARQQNEGAIQAIGDTLLFLHADTFLPDSVLDDLQTSNSKWGRFNVKLSGKQWIFRLIETLMNWRSCLTGIATGDQAMFISSTLFKRMGGFPEIALMEDIALSKKLKKQTRPACLKSRVVTSSRRWEEQGILKTILTMWWFRLTYFLGCSPESIQKKYYTK